MTAGKHVAKGVDCSALASKQSYNKRFKYEETLTHQFKTLPHFLHENVPSVQQQSLSNKAESPVYKTERGKFW